jgi:hypothetical protein
MSYPLKKLTNMKMSMKLNRNYSSALLCSILFLSSCGGNSMDEQKSTDVKNNSNVPAEAVEKTKEEAPKSEKEIILSGLIGDHALTSISGFMGANTMVDYTLERGKWLAQGSAIEEGMRQAYDIDLEREDIKMLSSMKIQVSKDLSVKLMCNGKTYYTMPMNANGMAYFLRDSPKKYSSNFPAKLSESATVIGDYLYLYAKDHVSENEISSLNITEVFADVISISYNIKSKQFEMSLFYGECCDNSIYYFK